MGRKKRKWRNKAERADKQPKTAKAFTPYFMPRPERPGYPVASAAWEEDTDA